MKRSAVLQYLEAIRTVLQASQGPAVEDALKANTAMQTVARHPWLWSHKAAERIKEHLLAMQSVVDTAQGEGVPAASRAIHALKIWFSEMTGWPRDF